MAIQDAKVQISLFTTLYLSTFFTFSSKLSVTIQEQTHHGQH